jgi:hypothetical protein
VQLASVMVVDEDVGVAEESKGRRGESANAPFWMELTASSELSTEDFIKALARRKAETWGKRGRSRN